jgi:hypothetical protein
MANYNYLISKKFAAWCEIEKAKKTKVKTLLEFGIFPILLSKLKKIPFCFIFTKT